MQTSLDTKEKHSGQRSLRLIFDGRRNVNFTDVCHIAFVEPGGSYRFSAWVHTQALTTEQGVRFRLEWTENAHGAAVETSDVHGTQPWTEVSIPWTASGDDARRVRVCVSRKPGDDSGSRIHGTAWIDDVALVPASPVAPSNLQPAAPPASKSAPASPTPTTSPAQPPPSSGSPRDLAVNLQACAKPAKESDSQVANPVPGPAT